MLKNHIQVRIGHEYVLDSKLYSMRPVGLLYYKHHTKVWYRFWYLADTTAVVDEARYVMVRHGVGMVPQRNQVSKFPKFHGRVV